MSQFIQDCIRTESQPEKLEFSKGGLFILLNLLVASAEVADVCKRAIYYGKGMDTHKLANRLTELGVALSTLNSVAYRVHLPEDVPTDGGLIEPNLRLLHAALGCFTESGELLEAVRGEMVGSPIDPVNIGEELFDVDWYQAIAQDVLGLNEEEIRAKGIAKLKARYPEKFNSQQAVERDLGAERAALEGEQA